MTCVENHHTLIGQDKEGGIVMVIGLEIGTNQHICLTMLHPVVLCGFHIAMHINITDIGRINRTVLILVMQGTRVGKPAPCTFLSNEVATRFFIVLSHQCQCSAEH